MGGWFLLGGLPVCHLGGMEAISTTDSGNEAEPQENYQHTSFASPLETPITLEQPANVPQTICHIKMLDIAAALICCAIVGCAQKWEVLSKA